MERQPKSGIFTRIPYSSLTVKEQDIHRRNIVVLVAMAITSLLILASLATSSSVSLDAGAILVITLQPITTLIYAGLFYLRRFIPAMGYYAVITSSVSTFISVTMSPNISNVFSIYYLVVMALIFMNLRILLIGTVVGFVLLITILFGQQEKLQIAKETQTTYIIYYLLITTMFNCLYSVSRQMMRRMEESRLQTEQLLEQ